MHLISKIHTIDIQSMLLMSLNDAQRRILPVTFREFTKMSTDLTQKKAKRGRKKRQKAVSSRPAEQTAALSIDRFSLRKRRHPLFPETSVAQMFQFLCCPAAPEKTDYCEKKLRMERVISSQLLNGE
jgi:hypothetical protein